MVSRKAVRLEVRHDTISPLPLQPMRRKGVRALGGPYQRIWRRLAERAGACNMFQGPCCGCGNALTGRSTSRRLTAFTVSSSRLPRGRRGPPLRTITGCFQGGIAAVRAAAAAAENLLAAAAGDQARVATLLGCRARREGGYERRGSCHGTVAGAGRRAGPRARL